MKKISYLSDRRRTLVLLYAKHDTCKSRDVIKKQKNIVRVIIKNFSRVLFVFFIEAVREFMRVYYPAVCVAGA